MGILKIVKWGVLALSVGLTAKWIVSLSTTGEPVGVGITGPIMLVIIVPVLFSMDRSLSGGVKAERFRGAPIGIGTVVSVRPTGLQVNDQPQLEFELDVDTEDGTTFRASARQIVPVHEAGAVRAGARMPVRYLPESADGKVVLATDVSPRELQAAFNRIRVATGEMTARQLDIAERGVRGRAVVLSAQPTGEIRHDRAVIRIELRVTRADGTAFDVVQEKALAPEFLPKTQPGAVIDVHYLPHDESEIVLAIRAGA
ncbi:hypothetical protein SAMN05421805_107185 [Saccharopolyspora antimicrobica]|uniref:Uncharacterized protein n=1 Tax=Saccharopolyspora antimicrobica TaxID=455193 RepID=A0A1I5CHE3_9PSEU|nr:hypothetical protein [Saccharopolyspora antimicrobica]RKT88852.1 hypothetical protein ATL45_7295 [Saccharopolyspora antimicrobica]SFN86449.1 hypothetical protein SAMN05421805_107185 [Saccharopolyspora antimicrobica]